MIDTSIKCPEEGIVTVESEIHPSASATTIRTLVPATSEYESDIPTVGGSPAITIL